MKKSLLSIVGVAITAIAFGQFSNNSAPQKMFYNSTSHITENTRVAQNSSRANGNETAALGVDLFKETFAAGLAGDVVNGVANGAWTTSGKGGDGQDNLSAVWEYRGPSTVPSSAVGSRGAYDSGVPIQSPTAAGGFFIFDSDYLDNGGVAANTGLGMAPSPHESYLISPTFSTIGHDFVNVDFNAFFRRGTGDAYLLLSIDGGATWGDSIVIMNRNINANYIIGVAPDFYISESVNFLGNQADCKIAFYFDGISNGNGYYFISVDDVTISSAPDNNLAITSNYLTNQIDTGFQLYYSMVPSAFAHLDTIYLGAKVENRGATDQTNVILSSSVTTPVSANNIESLPITIVAGTKDSLVADEGFVLDKGIGEYSWTYSVESADFVDDIPSDNTLEKITVEVTDSTYARDKNVFGNIYYGPGDAYEVGPIFEIYDTVKATSVTLEIGSETPVGENISIYIYDGSNFLTPIASREFISLTADQIGAEATFSIPEVLLIPGVYLVTFRTYTDAVRFPISLEEADNQTVYLSFNADDIWYYTHEIPVVRLNVSEDLFLCDMVPSAFQNGNNSATISVTKGTAPYTFLWSEGSTTQAVSNLASGNQYSVTVTDANGCEVTDNVDVISGIIESEIEGDITLYPNPNNGEFQLRLDNVENGVYNISVKNIVGQVVYQNVANVSGSYNENVKLPSMLSGIYFMEISNKDGISSVLKFLVK